jgi:hypothetical protein
MIDVSAITGAMKQWRLTLQRELALDGMYENVSAVCLFASRVSPTEEGEAQKIETVVVSNRAAAHQLPEWANTRLRSHEEPPIP